MSINAFAAAEPDQDPVFERVAISAAGAVGSTLAQIALDRIVTLIRDGELVPGGVVNEVDLAKRFEMSRGPIREAVRNLEGRKLIVREAYQRARIVDLGAKQIKELFEMRECLEGMACRLATNAMSDEQMEQFIADVELRESQRTRSRFYTEDFNFFFHNLILRQSGNTRIQELLTAEVYELVRLYRWTANAIPGRDGHAHVEHWQIARAMKARDADLAESLMRAHIQRSMQTRL